jgi:cell division protein FtsQ
VKRPEGFDRDPEPTPAQQPARAARPAARQKPVAREKPARPARAEREARRATSAPHPDDRAIRSPGAQERAQRRIERAEARRFTRSSRRRRITWLSVGAIVLVLIAVLAVAIFSPVLALRTIRVEGASAVKASAVRNALDDQLGTPLALLDTGKIDRDLSHFILIRSYVTEIVPPNTLVVRIEERQPIGVIAEGNTYERVDPAGVVLGDSASRGGLPVIDIGSARVGSRAFQAAVEVLLAMPTSVSSKVETITASTLDNVSLTLAGTRHTVIWGSASQSDEKARVLAVLLGSQHCRSLKVLNITAPSVIACGNGQPISTPTSTPTPTGTPTPPAG